MNVPKKWWWLVAVLVPVCLAVIAIVPSLLDLFRDKNSPVPLSAGVIIQGGQIQAKQIIGGDQFTGDQIRNEVAFTTITVIAGQTETTSGVALPDNALELLRQAMHWIEAGDYDKAIPLLETAAESAPLPAVFNNLAAAYLATGDLADAQATLAKAEKVGDTDPEVTVALRYNRRRLAALSTHQETPLSGPHPTAWKGIVARLTRFEDTGGMLTAEAIFQNPTPINIPFCLRPLPPESGYLIDEQTGESWKPKFFSTYADCDIFSKNLGAGENLTVWMKFEVSAPSNASFTAVFPGISRPFEGLIPTTSTR